MLVYYVWFESNLFHVFKVQILYTEMRLRKMYLCKMLVIIHSAEYTNIELSPFKWSNIYDKSPCCRAKKMFFNR